MICEHCGGSLIDNGNTCMKCGMGSVKPPPKSSGKVIPFRSRKKKRTKSLKPGWRQIDSITWIIVAIIMVSLLAPYFR